MLQTPPKSLTLEEFLKLPETEPASEYIEGQIVQKPTPQGKRSVIQGELVTAINTGLNLRLRSDLASSVVETLKPQRIARAFTAVYVS